MKSIINKIKENYDKNQKIYTFGIIAIIIFCMIVLMTKFYMDSKILRYTSHISNQDKEQFVHDFTSGMVISQKFYNYSDFDFITLSFSDHDQQINGKVGIRIKDVSTDTILFYEEKESSEIHYKEFVEIPFDNFGGGYADKLYEIELYSLGTEDVGLGVYGYKNGEEKASVNGGQSEYTLSIGIHSYTNLYKSMTIGILGIGMLSILIAIWSTFVFKAREEVMFLILTIPFVLCMLFLWPGNEVYDEGRHYHTVYHYSNQILGCGAQDTITEIQMRKCDVNNSGGLEGMNTTVNAQAQRFWYYLNRISDKAEDTAMVNVDVSSMPVVNDGKIIQYLPGVIGMTLARILGANYFWMMTITRMAIISFYLCMCYYAIMKIPVLKMLLVLVSALPMNLYQTAGISYDSFTYAVGIVVFAFIIKLWHEGLEKKDWIKYAIAVAVLGNCKGGVYLTLILLMCLIPKEKYISKKWLKFGAILAIAGISMLSGFMRTIISWFIVIPQTGNTSEVINSGGVIAEKLSPFFLLKEPIRFIEMFIQTMMENWDVYLGQMLGYRTAWANEKISLVVMLPFLVFLILAAVGDEKENFKISPFARLGILAILFIELVGMQVIFLGETPVYSDLILGFQGRYFILFIPCILLLFRNDGLVFKEKKEYLYPCFSMAQLVYLFFFLELFMQA